MPALLINNEIYGDTPFDKQQKIINVINQASKSWIMPNDIEIAHQGIGAPNITVESGTYYLDVVSGNVYLGGTEWVLDRTFTSVQGKLSELKDSVYGTLLWTNPNASAEFAAQTLDVDVSGYEYFVVEWLQGTGISGRRCQTIVYPTTTDISAANMQQIYAIAQYIQFNSRGCYVSGGKVAFSQGVVTKISSAGAFTAPATANNIAVPYRIIGYNKIIE